MTGEEANTVLQRMGQEGFHYCFKHYSSFDEIEDEEFHKLRRYYLQHAELLEKYLKRESEKDNW
jgi:hypothetical protein